MSDNPPEERLKPCTHKELVIAAEKWLNKRGVLVTLREIGAYTCNNENPDVIGWSNSSSVVIECKVSRSDFLADKKKWFRQFPKKGMGDYRIYFCPPNVIKVSDLPEGWALVYYDGKKTKNIHGINGYRMVSWHEKAHFKSNIQAERDMLYSVARRIQIQGHLDCIYDSSPVSRPNQQGESDE